MHSKLETFTNLVRHWLLTEQQPVTEYQLLRRLQSDDVGLLSPSALNDPLSLFQVHFLLFNLLYHLQNEFLDAGRGYLHISALHIKLEPRARSEQGVSAVDPLKSYYLDWRNFNKTSEQDVTDMLDSFWQRIGSATQIVDGKDLESARKILAISGSFNQTELKKHYRRMLHQYHPDKGGKTQDAQDIEWAYQILLRTL